MIADRYELEDEIGRGGMGAVWRGRDTRLGRIVALKRLGEVGTADGPGRERAHREALLAAQLNHAHIVSVHDLVEDDEGWTWLVMEHVPGITLSQAIAKGSLQTEAIARIGRQVAEALAAAHAAGISHRDVKPSNILLTEDGTAKLSDFGIARGENDAAITRTGQVTGSPAYLPPEVARGANGGPAGDMWSLGATLFHAAAGHTPYAGEGDGVAVLFRIVHEAPPRLTDRGDLTAVVSNLMTVDPAGRPDAASTAIALAVIAGDSRTEATQAISPLAGGPAPDPEATSLIAATVDPESTSVIAAPESRPVAEPTPVDRREPRRSRPWIVAAALLGALLLVGALVLALGGDDGDGGDSGSLTSEELDAFGREFVQTAASDPDAAFEMLTPEAQSAVGGIEAFRDSWEPAGGASVTQVVSDASAETVSVACEWTVETSRSSFSLPTSTSDEAVEPTDPAPTTTAPEPTATPTPTRTPTPTPTPSPTPTPTPEEEDDEPSTPEPEVETVSRTVTLHVVRDGDRLVVDQYSQR